MPRISLLEMLRAASRQWRLVVASDVADLRRHRWQRIRVMRLQRSQVTSHTAAIMPGDAEYLLVYDVELPDNAAEGRADELMLPYIRCWLQHCTRVQESGAVWKHCRIP